MSFEDYIDCSPYSLTQREKERRLLPDLVALTRLHVEKSNAYARIVRATCPDFEKARRLADLPWIPVSLFKTHELSSISGRETTNILTSSGTSGQAVSRIAVDGETAGRQAMALTSLMAAVLGPKRLPMIVVDCKSVIKNPALMSARGAGVLGMMRFGRDVFFALDDDMTLDRDGLAAFLEKFGGGPFFLFGFTFVVWRYFFQILQPGAFDLSQGILIHSGGWKRMEAEAVDNAVFRETLHRRAGLRRIHNFYGMVEQLGGVWLEGEDGFLHAPLFGDAIIRDPQTLAEAPPGQPGLIQLLSLVPTSYPGHSILTEDIGVLQATDNPDSQWKGKAITVLGRAPKAELRGCSDVSDFKAGEGR